MITANSLGQRESDEAKINISALDKFRTGPPNTFLLRHGSGAGGQIIEFRTQGTSEEDE
jgi:hypothetical protein